MNKLKNLIFDLGGVIVDLTIEPSLKAFAQLGLTPKGIQMEQLSNNGIPPEWEMRKFMHAMDCGNMSGDEFLDILKAESLPGTTKRDILDAFNSVITLRAHRLEWLQKLKKHYRVYLLSNIGDLHWQETRRQALSYGIHIEDCFHQTFLSYQLRMVKPDPQIFQHVIHTTGIQPEETLYIDDLPDNIEAGKDAGLMAHKIACNTLDTELPRLFPEIL